MPRTRFTQSRTLTEKYPPSAACSFAQYLSFYVRPGWWMVEEAACALDAGYGL